MSGRVIFVGAIALMFVTGAMAAECFSTGRDVLGAINAISFIVSFMTAIRAS